MELIHRPLIVARRFKCGARARTVAVGVLDFELDYRAVVVVVWLVTWRRHLLLLVAYDR